MSVGCVNETAEQIRQAFCTIGHGRVVEIRVIHPGGPPLTGFFDNADKIVEAIAWLPEGNVYITLNAIKADRFAVTNQFATASRATADDDIERRQWILIDVDPVRQADQQTIPATDMEHEAALAKTCEIEAGLRITGWPDPVRVDTGNGAALLYAIDLLADDADLVRRCLQALAARFDDEAAQVDIRVANASRIARLPGTVNRKGQATEDRPYRMARFLDVPQVVEVVSVELLENLAGQVPASSRAAIPAACGGNVTTDLPLDIEARVIKYIEATPGAISGQHGHDQTFALTMCLLHGFELPGDTVFRLLMEHHNPKCQPPWSERELRHKVESAAETEPTKPRGWLLRNITGDGQDDPQQTARPTISNSVTITEQRGEKAVTVTIPKSMPDILADIRAATDDWPRCVGSLLFVYDPATEGIDWLPNQNGLFGWLNSVATVRWQKDDPGYVTKGELFAELTRTATAYDSIELLPHHPRLPEAFYVCSDPAPGDGSALDQLVSFFRPRTEADRELIKAAFVTLFWGGPGGMRPIFLITSPDGRGSGKTWLVRCAGLLAGGVIELGQSEKILDFKTRLLSPEGRNRRVVLLDNIKSDKFSSGELEALITAEWISGRQLYSGEGRRPNNLIYFLTVNGPSLSTDLAQRVVNIELQKPNYCPTWESDVTAFIGANRDKIIGDCLAILQRPAVPMIRNSRWSGRENAVLSKMADPDRSLDLITERQQGSDGDNEEAAILRDYFTQQLACHGYRHDQAVFVSTPTARDWYHAATGEKISAVGFGRKIKQLADEDNLPCVPCRTPDNRSRGILWFMDQRVRSVTPADVCFDLEERIAHFQRRRTMYG